MHINSVKVIGSVSCHMSTTTITTINYSMCPLLSHLWQVPAGALLIGLIRIVVLFCFRSFGRPCGVKEAENRYFLFKRCHIIFSRNESIVVPAAAVVSLNASLVVFFSAFSLIFHFTSIIDILDSDYFFSICTNDVSTFRRSVLFDSFVFVLISSSS